MRKKGTTALLLRFLPLQLLLLVSGLTTLGQTANLSGTVRDSSHAVVPRATVTVTRENTGIKRETSSDDQGFYVLPFLLPGSYTITIEASGFQVLSHSGVKLDPVQEARLDFTLFPATLKQSVTVVGSVSSLQTESSAVGTEVDPQLVQDAPVNGRTIQSLIGLAPGVIRPETLNQVEPQSGTFVNGQRASSNYFSVDGVSVNLGDAAGTVPAVTVLGTTQNLVSLDDMQEFKLQTSTYSAEFGRAAGGQLQIVTRSGTNELHGSAFDYFRNEALTANNWFSNAYGLPRAVYRQNDFGGVLGGPLWKSRTFFFFSYEGLRLDQPVPDKTEVPSLSARQEATGSIQRLLNAFPLPSGPEDPETMLAPFVVNGSNLTSSDNTSIRIDHVLNQKVTVFGRYSGAPSETAWKGFTGYEESQVANFRSVTLGATLLLSAGATSDLRVNYSEAESKLSFRPSTSGGAVPPPQSLLFPAPFASPGTSSFALFGLGQPFYAGRWSDNLQRQANVVSNTSIVRGPHEVTFGGDYRHLAPSYGPPNYRQSMFFAGVSGALSGIVGAVGIFSYDQVTLGFNNLSLYGQDRWKVTPRFTLLYGLRWELNPPPHAKGNQPLLTLTGFPDLANLQLAPPGTPVYETTYTNFAPRVGAAYQLLERPGRETVIRGGFGVFYDLGAGNIGDAATYFPHSHGKTILGVPYPLSPQDAAPSPPPSLDPPYTGNFAVLADHQLPRTYQWNLTVDQRLGSNQVVSASYVGAAGRRLLRENLLTNPNPLFPGGNIFITTNTSSSNYQALQLQFQRHLTRGLAALLSYTWSHSIDDTSSDVGDDNLANPSIDRGASDFDVRHAFNAAFTYQIPGPGRDHALRAILSHWSTDSIFTARTALPINVFVDLFDSGIFDSNLLQERPDRVPGVPLYIQGAAFPGGRRVNPAAFSSPPDLRQGNLERNLVRGLPLTQWDFDIRRQFGITQKLKLQCRADFFNVLNHPNFGLVDGQLGLFGPPFQPNPTFGIAGATLAQFADVTPLYSVGGPRSIQFSLRLLF